MTHFVSLFTETSTTSCMSIGMVAPTVMGRKKKEDEDWKGLVESCIDCQNMDDAEVRSRLRTVKNQMDSMLGDEKYFGDPQWKGLVKAQAHLQAELEAREIEGRKKSKKGLEDEFEDDLSGIVSGGVKRL